MRLAGIKVVESGSPEAIGTSYLYIRVTSLDDVLEERSIGIIYHIQIQLKEAAFLRRASNREVLSESWNVSVLVAGPNKGFVDNARKRIKDYMDEFLNEYLAANPKE